MRQLLRIMKIHSLSDQNNIDVILKLLYKTSGINI